MLGLSGEAVDRYVDEWIVAITDVTPLAHTIRDLLDAGDDDAATALLPDERPYPPPPWLREVGLAGPITAPGESPPR